MAHTRTVTGLIHDPNGQPWADFRLDFTLIPSATTAHATLPSRTVSTTTDSAGTFAIDLEVGVAYLVTEYTAAIEFSARVNATPAIRYPDGTQYTIVVPEGASPIALETIRAGAISPQDDATLTNAVALLASDLSDHEGDHANPHQVTAGQAGAYTAAQTDALVGDVANDLATLAGSLGSAASTDSGDYATAAQGTTADSAVQPGDLATAIADFETTAQLDARDTANRDRANHTGTQAIATVSGLQTALDGKADDGDVTAVSGALAGHTGDMSNPHGVTKAQVGLGNVDNTSDADKPVSTATQTALDGKGSAGDVAANTAARHTHANKTLLDATTASYTTEDDSKLAGIEALADVTDAANVAAAGAVMTTGDQTVTGRKTFAPSDAAPALGASIGPALSAYTLSGSAAYSAPNITIGSAAGSMSADIAVTSGTMYQIDIDTSASSGGDITVSLGGASDTTLSWLRTVGLVAPSTGTLTLTVSGTSWSATVTGIRVRPVVLAQPAMLANSGEFRAYSTNIGFGQSTLSSNTKGSGNIAIGYRSLSSNTAGLNNTGVGPFSLQSNTTGFDNIAIGYRSLYSNTTGLRNTGVGSASLQSNTTGSHNTGVGRLSLFANTTGSENTGVGYDSGPATGAVSGSTSLGYQARANHDNSVALGVNTATSAADQVMVGGRDIEITEATKGVVLRSPNGSRWRLAVDNSGNLSAVAV